jgi:hypothetical protein
MREDDHLSMGVRDFTETYGAQCDFVRGNFRFPRGKELIPFLQALLLLPVTPGFNLQCLLQW